MISVSSTSSQVDSSICEELSRASRPRPIAVFDRAAGVYLDADGRALAPLAAVTFHRRMQLGSSSPKLVAQTPGGTYVLLRGNPFTGGLGNLDAVLTTAVHGGSR